MPDLDTLHRWCPGRTASPAFACDIQVDGEPWPYCSRTVLRRAIDRLAEAGYAMKVGVEAEHMLVDARRRTGRSRRSIPAGFDTLDKPCYDFKGLSGSMPYLRELIRYMEGARLGAVRVGPRGRHRPVRAQLEVRRRAHDRRSLHVLQDDDQPGRARGTAPSRPTCPSRSRDLTGNGSPLPLLALGRGGRERLPRSTPTRGASASRRLAYHFLGGLLAHARALSALIAPTVNCYKRLSIGAYLTGARSGFTWTPAFITYGDNNRTQMFRTPEPGRFECRVVSGAVNPYLGHGRVHRGGPRRHRARASTRASR